MFKKVMIPTDGSHFAEQAIPWAVSLLKGSHGRPVLVMVHELRPLGREFMNYASEQLDTNLRQAHKEYLGDLAQRLVSEHALHADTHLLTGPVVGTLARFAARPGLDLMVMSTHGHGGLSRLWLGSVADALVRRARVPTLLVRPQDARDAAPPAIRRVLVAVDGSRRAEAAVAMAAKVCATTGAACTIVRVVVPITHIISPHIVDTAHVVQEKLDQASLDSENYLRNLMNRTPALPDETRAEVVTAFQPAAAILKCAEEEGTDLIIMGTRGHGRAARLVLGSVADKVIRGAPIPVLVCPPVRPAGLRQRLAERREKQAVH